MLPATIGLTRLTLNDWRNSALPASIGQATSLKALTLNGCSFKTLPDSLAGLAGSLRTLTVKNCAVRSLPETIGQLTGLRSLLIDHCELLQALPESLGDLTGEHAARVFVHLEFACPPIGGSQA